MSEKQSNNANHASALGNSSVRPEITTNNSQAKPNFSSTTRLTSFLAPRDLTLGGNSVKLDKPKKVYTPNLNAQRKKKEDEPVVAQKNSKGPKHRHQKGKGPDRGSKHHKPNLIQSAGVFTEGLADGRSKSRYSSYRDSGDRSEPKITLQRPKLNAGRFVDKEEEEQKLKVLLRDDLIEDDNDLDYQNCPVVLPIAKEGKLFKPELVDIKIEPEEQIKIEDETVKEVAEEKEKKSAVIKNGKKKLLAKEKFSNHTEFDKKIAFNASQSLENKGNGYFLIRFPSFLPRAPNENEEDEAARPRKNTEGKTESEKPRSETVLDNLKEGLLGKIQILRSGNARLCLGDHNFLVNPGLPIFHREDVVVAKIDNERKIGELVNLGSVHTNLVCTPDWKSLI